MVMLPHNPIDLMDHIGLEPLSLQETINAITLALTYYIFCIIHLLKNKEEYVVITRYRILRIPHFLLSFKIVHKLSSRMNPK